MPYTHSLPTSASFNGKGLRGYTFGPLTQEDLEIYYVEVQKGHDVFMVSREITRTYYILSGSGYFTIEGDKYEVSTGMLVEVPPRVEYSYSGNMNILALSRPRWFQDNDTFTKWNPDVVGYDSAFPMDNRSLLTRISQAQFRGKSPVNAFLRLNQRLWNHLPSRLTSLTPIRSYGDLLHTLARRQGNRAQAFATLFLRNRPELELIRRLLLRVAYGDTLGLTVLGCSAGAEVYSIAWTIRSARPDIKLALHGIDIAEEAVAFAKRGEYPLGDSQLTGTQVFEAMTPGEMEEMFDRHGDVMTVKPWIKEGIQWHVGDVGEPEVLNALGPQDMVVANNFLCHMEVSDAELCLRNIARLVGPHGYLFVSGIDLDVRTKVANELGWEPLQELLEEIHDGDPYLRQYWPGRYAGLEPLNKRRKDWRTRYAATFQLYPKSIAQPAADKSESSNTRELSERVAVFPSMDRVSNK